MVARGLLGGSLPARGIICPSWFCFVSLSPRVRVRVSIRVVACRGVRRGAAVPVRRLPQVLHAEVRAQFARKNTYGLVAHINISTFLNTAVLGTSSSIRGESPHHQCSVSASSIMLRSYFPLPA